MVLLAEDSSRSIRWNPRQTNQSQSINEAEENLHRQDPPIHWSRLLALQRRYIHRIDSTHTRTLAHAHTHTDTDTHFRMFIFILMSCKRAGVYVCCEGLRVGVRYSSCESSSRRQRYLLHLLLFLSFSFFFVLFSSCCIVFFRSMSSLRQSSLSSSPSIFLRGLD